MSIPEYDKWKLENTPENLAGVLKALDPLLTTESQRYSGPKPLLHSRAKQLAIGAIQSYDPTKGAKLQSWVVTQLQPLNRYSQSLSPVRVPEMARRQAAELETQRKALHEELGRDPEDIELADYTGASIRRIQRLRSQVNAVMSESQLPIDPESGEQMMPGVSQSNMNDTAIASVYDQLDPRLRAVYDFSTGSNGQPVLPKHEIAKRLGVSPAAISQMTKQIALRIQKVREHV